MMTKILAEVPVVPKKRVSKKKTIDDAASVSIDVAVAAPKKRAPRKSVNSRKISPAERHHMVEIAAYYIAERRGFKESSTHDDWAQAEREVDAMIAAGRFAD